jgi:hypothetical protein
MDGQNMIKGFFFKRKNEFGWNFSDLLVMSEKISIHKTFWRKELYLNEWKKILKAYSLPLGSNGSKK